MRIKMMILLALVFILAACLPGQEPVDVQSQVNTLVAQAIETNQRQIEEAVALTVAAQQQQPSTPTAADEPTPVPTDTPAELPTLIFTPENTPLPILPTATRRPVQKAEYACNAISRRPFDNTEFNRKAKFDIKWTIVNTGTKTWPKGIDVKYYSGPQMTNIKRVEIPVALAPNQSYIVNLDAVAPDKKGFFVMTWIVDGPMCYPYTAINVK